MLTAEDSAPSPALAGVRDPGRVQVLDRVDQVTGPADPDLDRVARLAARLLSAPAAYVTLVGPDEQRSPGAVELDHDGEPTRRLELGDSICQFQVVTEEPLVIRDTRSDPLTEHNRTVLDGSIGAYAGMPLRTSGGDVLGSLCVVDRAPHAWPGDELRLLEDLAVIVSNDIEHRLANQRGQQVEAHARAVVDAWRPHADAVANLVELSERSDDPRLQAAASRLRASSGRVGTVTSRLGLAAQDTAPRDGTPVSVDLRRLVERAVGGARQATGTSSLSVDLPGTALPVHCDPVRAERAMVHLLVAALHHMPTGRVLAVRLTGAAASQDVGLELSAAATQVPAAELARLVSRFAGTVDCVGDRQAGPAALRMVRGGVQATSGAVTASSSSDGLVFRARWRLAQAPDAVIDLR